MKVISLKEVAGKTETMNLYEYEYRKKSVEIKAKFQWISNIELAKRNLECE